VRIEVREAQSAALQRRNLRRSLGFDLARRDAPAEQPSQKCAQRGVEAPGARLHQRGNLPRCELRLTVGQHHVATHAQLRQPTRQFDGLFRRRGARHQGGAGQQSGPVQFGNSAINAGGQPKIVGIEDETAHRLSVSTAAAPRQEPASRTKS